MRYLFIFCLLSCLGCPEAESVDAVFDAGSNVSSGTEVTLDAGNQNTSGQDVFDAGEGTSTEPANDAGVVNLVTEAECGTVAGAVLSLSWADDNLLPRINMATEADMSSQEIGTSTRSQIEAIFEQSPRTDSNLPYRWICDDHGLTFDFVDTPDANNLLDTVANDSDSLSRIIVDSSSSLVFLGHVISSLTPSTLIQSVGVATHSFHDYPDTIQMVVFPEKGFSFLVSYVAGTDPMLDGTLVSLTFFKPQGDDHWGASFNLADSSISFSSGTISTSQGFSGGSSFGSVTTVLGVDYDVNSTIEEDDFKANITTYASLGLRFVEGCGANPFFPLGDPFVCSGKVTVLMISSPFMGVDSNNGLRLGSTLAEVEIALGEGSVRIDDETGGEVYVYGSSSPKTGIIYGFGGDGTQRVAAFILNYIDENELP